MTKKERELKRYAQTLKATEDHLNQRLRTVREEEVKIEAQRTAINFVIRSFDKMFGAIDVVRLDFTTRTDEASGGNRRA